MGVRVGNCGEAVGGISVAVAGSDVDVGGSWVAVDGGMVADGTAGGVEVQLVKSRLRLKNKQIKSKILKEC